MLQLASQLASQPKHQHLLDGSINEVVVKENMLERHSMMTASNQPNDGEAKWLVSYMLA